MKNTLFLPILISLIISTSGFAKVRPAALFSDHMVLQQQSDVRIWGTADKSSKITINASWTTSPQTTQSDQNGKWSCTLKTPEAGGPYRIELSDGNEPTVLENVLIGEVWLCSGQSNMEMQMRGFVGQPVYGSQEAIATANPQRPIRLFRVKKVHSSTPRDTIGGGEWFCNTSEHVSTFSAAAYFFGSTLEKNLGVPVGLIDASWSGSPIQAFMDRETLSSFPFIKFSSIPDSLNKRPNKTPTLIYNGMIHPLQGLTVRGVIWYQGEANRKTPQYYQSLFTKMIAQWRKVLGNEKLPFYFVELAPTALDNANGETLPIFKEVQMKCMKEIPYTGMALTTDLGSEHFIHAPKKKEVGERLAYWALAKTYKQKYISFCGPIFKSCQLKQDTVIVSFDYAPRGLMPEKEDISGFEIAGADGVFHPAQARIMPASPKVMVYSPNVAKPQEIRYCFHNFCVGNLLFNTAGLPAASFRAKIK